MDTTTKKNTSIKLMILIPVIALGLVAFITSATSLYNITKVNGSASNIVDNYTRIAKNLSYIQKIKFNKKSRATILVALFLILLMF